VTEEPADVRTLAGWYVRDLDQALAARIEGHVCAERLDGDAVRSARVSVVRLIRRRRATSATTAPPTAIRFPRTLKSEMEKSKKPAGSGLLVEEP
jgi:hypothetical protein